MCMMGCILMSSLVVAQALTHASTIMVDAPIASLSSSSSASRQATWSLATNLGSTYMYDIESHKSKPNFVAEVQLKREVGRWQHVVGVDLYDIALFTMQVWEFRTGKFPIGVLALGEYSALQKESFLSVGSQISYAKNKIKRFTIRVYIGSAVEAFKPSLGLQCVIPFEEML